MIFGFIGSGNMGGAIIGGIINSDIASPENVIVQDKNEQALKNINEKYGVKVTSDNKETADKADVLFLCVSLYDMRYISTSQQNCNLEIKKVNKS